MNPDFSPKKLRGFLNVRIQMAGYRAEFPDERKSLRRPSMSFDEACAAERAAIMKRAGVTKDQFDLAIAGDIVSRDVRVRLWRALKADPSMHGVRLLGGSAQEEMR